MGPSSVKSRGLTTITPAGYMEAVRARSRVGEAAETFDSIWSYSSIEHDGLGRYSDPINPYGICRPSSKMTCMLKPGGLLFLSFPVATVDRLWWNVHRVYGHCVFPSYCAISTWWKCSETSPAMTQFSHQPSWYCRTALDVPTSEGQALVTRRQWRQSDVGWRTTR